MRAIDLHEHMRQIGTWVNWERTTDEFLGGDPQAEVTGIAVGWQGRISALLKAAEMGCNLFVSHEPVFDWTLKHENHPYYCAKLDAIVENNLIVYRCHDVWDRMPRIGIVDSWAAHLGLTEKLHSGLFENVYRSPANTLTQLAGYVAKMTHGLGQDGVEVIGDPDAIVTKVAIGCGAITKVETMVDLGADAVIVTDDGIDYWNQGAWALDRGIPMVVVTHPVAEEPGVKNMAAYIADKFPEVKTVHIPQGAMYKRVS